MTDAQEKRLIEALRKVDAHGDVAPAHVQDPMKMVLRQRSIQADLMRCDDSRGHYVLTGTGRSRISARSRVPGAVVRFKTRNDRGDARRTGKPIDDVNCAVSDDLLDRQGHPAGLRDSPKPPPSRRDR